jgi:hypothetical protein
MVECPRNPTLRRNALQLVGLGGKEVLVVRAGGDLDGDAYLSCSDG